MGPDSGSSVETPVWMTPVETLRPDAQVDPIPDSAVQPDSESSAEMLLATLRPDAQVDPNPNSAVQPDSESSAGTPHSHDVGTTVTTLRPDAQVDPNPDAECPDAGAETLKPRFLRLGREKDVRQERVRAGCHDSVAHAARIVAVVFETRGRVRGARRDERK